MLYEKIKADIIIAMKNKDEVRKNALRLIASDLEMQKTVTGDPITDEKAIKTLQKAINSNLTVLGTKEDLKLKKENEIFTEYLPSLLAESEIRVILMENKDKILAKPERAREGFCLSFFKGKMVDKEIVQNVWRSIQ